MKKFLVLLLAFVMIASNAFALEISEPGVLPLTTEAVTLSIGIPQDTTITDYEVNYLTQLIEKETGVDLTFQLLPVDTAEAKQKLSLMIASGQRLPDILCLSLNDAEKLSYGTSGYFVPLNEYFENSATYWNEAMDKWCSPEEKADVLKYAYSADGNMYSFPGYYVDPGDATALGMWINKNWCDQLGLEVPTTTEELYNVLKAFKENDCNGNGNPDDEIPLLGHNGWMGDVCTYLINSFVYDAYAGDFGYQMSVEDGKLYAPFATEEFHEALRYLNKLCSEGLLSPLSFSQGQTELKAILSAPNEDPTLVGAFVGHPSPLFGSKGAVDRVQEYVACPAMIGPEGVQWSPNAGWLGKYTTYITADCEYPELAFRVLDACAREDISISFRYGEKDVDWGYTSEGLVRHYIEDYAPVYKLLGSGRPYWGGDGNITWHQTAWSIFPPKLMGGLAGDPYAEGNRRYQMDVLWYQSVPLRYDRHPDEAALKLIFNEEEIDMVGEIEATLKTYVKEAVANFTLGNKNIETDWETYLTDLENIGLSNYLEVAQKVYDRMNSY